MNKVIFSSFLTLLLLLLLVVFVIIIIIISDNDEWPWNTTLFPRNFPKGPGNKVVWNMVQWNWTTRLNDIVSVVKLIAS